MRLSKSLFAMCAGFFLALPLDAQQPIALPEIGQSGGALVTPSEERRTGEAVLRNFRRVGAVLEDPLVTDYISHLGYRLVSEGDSSHYQFHFFVVNDGNINAFALPGGYIGINYGLLTASESESELASVFAHEIAHVTQRHHARSYEFAEGNNIPVIAALIAAIILGSQGSELGSAALATLAGGTAQQQINFTRENEKEADYIGIQLLADSGFNPHDMASFFHKLDKQSRLYGPSLPEFLRTHPVNQSRIADASNRASQYALPDTVQSSLNYHLMRARLQVLTSNNKKKLVAQLNANIKDKRYQNYYAAQYALALALSEVKRYNDARPILQKLLKQDPGRIAYLIASAELESKAKNYERAIQILEHSLQNYPGNLPIIVSYVSVLLETNQAKQAREVLLSSLNKNTPSTPLLYKMLADAESKLGNRTDTHVAMGQFYYHIGLIHQAIDQLKLGLKESNLDYYNTVRIEARLKDYKTELAQLAQLNK